VDSKCKEIDMNYLSQTAYEKLNRYHREAETYRSLPRTPWRFRVATGLRALANTLELETQVGGLTSSRAT
jgi:hypothetical protein